VSQGARHGNRDSSTAGASDVRTLIPGERLIAQSPDQLVTLTSHRVQYFGGGPGNTRYTSITLDQIASCGFTTTSQPALIILGILIAIGGLVTGDEGGMAIGFFIGLLMIVIFFTSQSAVLLICSAGGERISLPAAASQRNQLLTLLYAVDEAILAKRLR
jgi:hypothetical protein